MDKVKSFLTNKWFRIFLGLLTGAYTVLLCYIAYAVIFYDIEYTNKVLFAVIYTVISLITGGLVFYTRKSPITATFAMLNMIIFLPTLLVDFGNWPLLIPGILVVLFSFFCVKMNVTAKTVIGTIFLLMYIIGGIGFYVMMNMFRVRTVDTLLGTGVSPSHAFRYYVLDVKNNSSGKTVVYIQPNNLDIDLDFIKLNCTIKRRLMQDKNPVTVKCEWEDEKFYINDKLYFDEADYLKTEDETVYTFEEGDWTYSYFDIDYPLLEIIHSLTQKLGDNNTDKNTPNDLSVENKD